MLLWVKTNMLKADLINENITIISIIIAVYKSVFVDLISINSSKTHAQMGKICV